MKHDKDNEKKLEPIEAESILDGCLKLIKYLLIPVTLFTSAFIISSQKIFGSFAWFYTSFISFLSGAILALIYFTFSSKISDLNTNRALKVLLKISLLLVLLSLYISSMLLSFSKIPKV